MGLLALGLLSANALHVLVAIACLLSYVAGGWWLLAVGQLDAVVWRCIPTCGDLGSGYRVTGRETGMYSPHWVFSLE